MISPEIISILVSILGEKCPSQKILDAVSYLGFFNEEPSLYDDSFYWLFIDSGVDFNFDEEQISQISCYISADTPYKNFENPIFKNYANKELTKEKIENLLGKPTVFGGGHTSEIFGLIPSWIKYQYDGFDINFEFYSKKNFLKSMFLINNKAWKYIHLT